MKTNKLKLLSIAACCSVTVLWTEIQSMQEIENQPRRSLSSYSSRPLDSGQIKHKRECLRDDQRSGKLFYSQIYKYNNIKYQSENVEKIEEILLNPLIPYSIKKLFL